MCAPAASSAKETRLGFFDDAEEKLCPCALARVFSAGMWSSRCARLTQRGSALHVGTALASRDGAASGSGVAAWAKLSWLEEAPGVTMLPYYYHYHYDHYCDYYHCHYFSYDARLRGRSRGHHVVHVARLTSPWPGASAALGRQLVF